MLPILSMAYIAAMPYLAYSPISLREIISAPFVASSRALGFSTFYVALALATIVLFVRTIFFRSSKDQYGTSLR